VSAVHELSLCHSMQEVVARAANGRPVDTVHLQVGRFRQVVPDTLAYCWSLVVADTQLAGSRLAIDHVDITLRCATCAGESRVDGELLLLCHECGSGEVSMLTGEEFLITTLDLKEK
jgi:hydrogenase nickel incorporation protein HypA/HybF